MGSYYDNTQTKYNGIDTAVSDPSAAPLFNLYLYKKGTKHISEDYGNGNNNIEESNVRDNGHDSMRITNSPIFSPSPPRSFSSSDMLSQSSLDYHFDSDSQGYSYNQCASRRLHGQHISVSSSVVESPDSLQDFSASSSVQPKEEEEEEEEEELCANFVSYDGKSMKHMLEELESVLLGPDNNDDDRKGSLELHGDDNSSPWTDLLDEVAPAMIQLETQNGGHCVVDPRTDIVIDPCYSKHSLTIEKENPGNQVKNLLIMCASAVDEGKQDIAMNVIQELRMKVSIFGDPIERLAAYMLEGLVARIQSSGLSIYKFLKCTESPSPDILSAMQKLYEICPYIKFAYMAANGAIAEAFRDEAKVHIFDFQISQGTQWYSLIQGLANRPGGPPSLRITTVEEKGAQASPIGGMEFVEERLSKLAMSLNVPFEFKCIYSELSKLQADMIELREGEALAVNFNLQLHHLPDESVCVTNPRDRMLRMMKSLNPKVFTMVEQEANTNTSPFFLRFMETLNFYSAIFESIDVALPRESKDRVNVEEQCLARDIVNVIACEGLERMERHELMGKWRARMMMAGFSPRPLSSHVNSIIANLLESYNSNYVLKEEGDALYLGWMNRYLIVASAWQ